MSDRKFSILVCFDILIYADLKLAAGHTEIAAMFILFAWIPILFLVLDKDQKA